mmetsp:Transcript_22699/g.40150  ORF Transcript_22699/g.40150 Transcript_22699/m.40150 type:complete len:126 (-) Transcript_22699:2-379(-)
MDSKSVPSEGQGLRATTEFIARPQRWYLLLQIDFKEGDSLINEVTVLGLLLEAIQTLFGKAGSGAYSFDVVKVSGNSKNQAIVAVDDCSMVPVWGALSLLSSYRGKCVRILVVKASPFLIALTQT